MQSVDLIISAPWVLPIAPDDTPLTDHAVAIDQGHIVALLPIEVMAERFEAKKAHHLPHHILMPGLVNTHTHTPRRVTHDVRYSENHENREKSEKDAATWRLA